MRLKFFEVVIILLVTSTCYVDVVGCLYFYNCGAMTWVVLVGLVSYLLLVEMVAQSLVLGF